MAKEVLLEHGADPQFRECVRMLPDLEMAFRPTTSTKGELLETIVRTVLTWFNSKRVSDLPFIKVANLPAWCNEAVLDIKEIKQLNNLEFLSVRPTSVLLWPDNVTRPDGIW
jgi:hypothetical protein